jgi:hypothetical protein
MEKHYRRIMGLVILIFAAGFTVGTVSATEKKDMQGWELDSPYNQYYDVREFEKFRAWVIGFKEEAPMPGMSPATILIVRDGSDIIDVHLCPTWFAKPEDVGVKKGDRVKIRGVWAEINGKDVFLASKVKKGDMFEFKVRLTKNGKPFWAMSAEELAWERLPDEEKKARQKKSPKQQ